MENILTFFSTYGLILTLIAVAGVAVLGFLKYCNVFSKLAETSRHILYLSISVGLSLIASAIYLAVIHAFSIDYFLALAVAIYLFNQTMYNIFKVTNLNDLCVKILDFLKHIIIKEEKPAVDDKNTKSY